MRAHLAALALDTLFYQNQIVILNLKFSVGLHGIINCVHFLPYENRYSLLGQAPFPFVKLIALVSLLDFRFN